MDFKCLVAGVQEDALELEITGAFGDGNLLLNAEITTTSPYARRQFVVDLVGWVELF